MGTQQSQPTQQIQPRRSSLSKRLGRSRLAVVGLLLSVLTVAAACAQQAPGGTDGPSGSPPSSTTPPAAAPTTSPPTTALASPPATTAPASTAPPSTGAPAAAAVDLSISLTESPSATPRQFRLVADGSTPSALSTLPDPAAALAAVELHGEKLFFPVPDPNRVCTEQYGGPEVAVVTGSFNGKAVKATFKRTNGCEIASWKALAPLFGALGGGTGAI